MLLLHISSFVEQGVEHIYSERSFVVGIFPKRRSVFSAREVGIQGETAIISRLAACGYVVLTPVGGNRPYDLVIEDAEGQFWRVQCKTARPAKRANGAIEFSKYTVASNGRSLKQYNPADVQYFAVYYPPTRTVYLVPHSPGTMGYLRLVPSKRMKGREWCAEKGDGLLASDYEI